MEPRQFKLFPLCVGAGMNGIVDAGGQCFRKAEIMEKEVPEKWVSHFEAAEAALESMRGKKLKDYLPPDFDYTQRADPDDDAIDAVATGENSVANEITKTVKGGEELDHLLDEIFDGELTPLFVDLYDSTPEKKA